MVDGTGSGAAIACGGRRPPRQGLGLSVTVGADVAEWGVAAGVVEAFGVLEDRDASVIAAGEGVPGPCGSVSGVAEKLSHSALSYALPLWPMLGTAPACWRVLPKARLVCWEPRSEWCTRPGRGRRCSMAIPGASRTSSAFRSSRIDQPTQRRLQASVLAAGSR